IRTCKQASGIRRGLSETLCRERRDEGHFETHAAQQTIPLSSMNPQGRRADTRWMILTLEPSVGAPLNRSDLLRPGRDGCACRLQRSAECLIRESDVAPPISVGTFPCFYPYEPLSS